MNHEDAIRAFVVISMPQASGGNMNSMATATVLTLAFAIAAPAASQWLTVPLPGTPRTPDGKPDLTAPAPKLPDGKPDLSGMWVRNTPGVNYLGNLSAGGAEIS